MLVSALLALALHTNKPPHKGGAIVAQNAVAASDIAQCSETCNKHLDDIDKYTECQNACLKPALDQADAAMETAKKVVACVGKCGNPLKVTSANAAQYAACANKCKDPFIGVQTNPSPSAPAPSPPIPHVASKEIASRKQAGCFSKASTSACRMLVPDAIPSAAFNACYNKAATKLAERVLMADLVAGDLVLTTTNEGGLTVTRVLVNQHAKTETRMPMLSLKLTGGTVLSVTHDHGLFVEGTLAAAGEATPGSALSGAHGQPVMLSDVSVSEETIINPVTAVGTILASDMGPPVLAASHPMWIAPYLLAYPIVRAVANTAVIAVGSTIEVTSALGFASILLAKVATATAVVRLVKKRSHSK